MRATGGAGTIISIVLELTYDVGSGASPGTTLKHVAYNAGSGALGAAAGVGALVMCGVTVACGLVAAGLGALHS